MACSPASPETITKAKRAVLRQLDVVQDAFDLTPAEMHDLLSYAAALYARWAAPATSPADREA